MWQNPRSTFTQQYNKTLAASEQLYPPAPISSKSADVSDHLTNYAMITLLTNSPGNMHTPKVSLNYIMLCKKKIRIKILIYTSITYFFIPHDDNRNHESWKNPGYFTKHASHLLSTFTTPWSNRRHPDLSQTDLMSQQSLTALCWEDYNKTSKRAKNPTIRHCGSMPGHVCWCETLLLISVTLERWL